MTLSNLKMRYAAALLLCCCVIGCTNNGEDNGGRDEPAVFDNEVRTIDELGAGKAGNKVAGPVYLKQGWSNETREQFYFLSQGSQLVPYDWFLWLEQAKSQELFRSDANMEKLGFISQPKSRGNPDALPIGFAKDDDPASVMPKDSFAMKRGFLGPNYDIADYPGTNSWLGLTCAACHTNDIHYKGKVIRIDGGPAMADIETFKIKMAAALRATCNDDAKFACFARHVREGLDNAATRDVEAKALKNQLKAYTGALEREIKDNTGDHPYGFARLDAFGAILNKVCAATLEIPDNLRPSNAPVSYPFLWDTPQLDWVQWNSTAQNAIARNVGEVLGVFSHFELTNTPDKGYASTARLDKLHQLEGYLRDLEAPPWPEHFGKIDDVKAAAGKELFAANCADCHNWRNDDDNFKMTPPNQYGNSFIETTSVPFNKIGTDSQMVLKFATRTAKPGILEGAVKKPMKDLKANGGLEGLTKLRAKLGMPAPDFSQEVPAVLLLKEAVSGVTKRYLVVALKNRTDKEKQEILLDLRGGRPNDNPRPPRGGLGYKARPLNGIWATAPFLHNGSVPNLYQLLLPAKDRVDIFYVGIREFDPVKVGFVSTKAEGMFRFDTTIKGNLNSGHEGHLYTQTKGKDTGEWCDFTDEERWALVEYMKTLK